MIHQEGNLEERLNLRLQSLEQHLLDMLESHRQLDDLRHKTDDDRTELAAVELNRRLDGMNQFREQIEQERGTFLYREMYEREHSALADRVKTLEVVRGEQDGKESGRTAVWGGVIVVITIAMQVILHIWHV